MEPNSLPPNQNSDITPVQTQAPVPAPTPTPLLAAPLSRILIGGTFLAISVTSGMALVMAYLPAFPDSSASQVAAAEAPKAPSLFDSIQITARAGYVIDASNDAVLYEKNANAQLPLASITKVVLTLVAAEVLPMESTVTISAEAVQRGGGGLVPGEIWRVRDLIDYMLIASSNTAAEALREAAEDGVRARYPQAPAENAAIWRMNSLTKGLGMSATYFLNPSGLDESLTQAGALGSAKDIATLFSYALRTNRELFAGTSREFATLGPINAPKRDIHNTNEALSAIPHIYMGKTGLTDLAGGNLAIAFDAEENHPVIVVVLGSTQEGRFTDVETLVNAATSTLAPPLTPQ